jgi:hypothetical protein
MRILSYEKSEKKNTSPETEKGGKNQGITPVQ